MRWMWTRAVLVGAIGLAAGSTAGCAEERPPINQVQPYALPKSFFVGDDLQSSHDDPEFWSRQTVTDVGYGAAQDGLFSSSWAQADLVRLKWVIQEDHLVGRITYERIDDSDGKGKGPAANDGQVAVIFKIQSHFDIRRDYNPTTGEEMNIVVENESDRPWYERQYMRVDWSQNLNTDAYDFDTLSYIGVNGGVEYKPLSYYVADPTHEDAPKFELSEGYFDVTTKAFAEPKVLDLSSLGWGIDAIPACFLDPDFAGGVGPYGNCNPTEITIRHSFRRVVDTDYEPVDWDGRRFQAYGPFLNERYGYARNYGMVDEKWHRFINRYNIWQRSHADVQCGVTPGVDPHRDEVNSAGDSTPDFTEDECQAVGRGSRCDEFTQKCTLPYRDRTPKPLQWYYTRDSHPDYFDGTEWAVHEWDVAMRAAVQAAKYGECRTVGDQPDCDTAFPMYKGQQDSNDDAIWLAREVDACRNRVRTMQPDGKPGPVAYAGEDCNALAERLGTERGMERGVIELAKMPEMIVLCHSPVAESDPASCGERGMVVRMGDLRYHNVNVFASPQVPSAWGIYTDSEDPLTGEKISASINLWSHVTDLWSQGVVDVVRYIKGELKTEDVTEGTFVHDWAAANDSASRQMGAPTMTRKQFNERLAAFAGVGAEDLEKLQAADGKISIDPKARERAFEWYMRAAKTRAEIGAPGANRAVYEQRRAALRGTPAEGELLTKPMQQWAGVDQLPIEGTHTGDMDGNPVLNLASPLRGASPTLLREIRRMKEMAHARKGACVIDQAQATEAPLSIHALGDLLEEKFGKFDPNQPKGEQMARAERMRKWVAQRGHYGVIIHEMGHSIGMRHNFLSSYDSFNYRPQYWQLRTNNGTVKDQCTELGDGTNCVGPRYFDPVTENERKNMIWMWSQSSVMDYPGDHVMDTIGLGAYDFAAARMFYGQMVAVFDNAELYSTKSKAGRGVMSRMDLFGGLVGINYNLGNANAPIHYSQLDKHFQLLARGADGTPLCQDVAPDAPLEQQADAVRAKFRPATWNEERDGVWHPLLDGSIVAVNGKYSRCKQQPVEYAEYQSLSKRRNLYGDDLQMVDPTGRIRVPYPFATDSWADLGNIAVYRHDNGADPYELVNFLIAQQEVNHIFDNYRRGRHGFSVRAASTRTLERYNEKLRDGAKGIGLIRNIYGDEKLAEEGGGPGSIEEAWVSVVKSFPDVVLASSVVFDHITRQMARPAPGPHLLEGATGVLRVLDGDAYLEGPVRVIVPNGVHGVAGGYGGMAIGGRPLQNMLANDKGEYDRDYTLNAGSYYDKINTSYLLTESEDNFISSSRADFLDPRFRAVSLADVFPDGWRRWVANNLTGDAFVKGPRLTAGTNGMPELEDAAPYLPEAGEECKPTDLGCRYPKNGIGWTSWWIPTGPESCFPGNGTTLCKTYENHGADVPFNPNAPANVVPVDPQVGWEQQKFLIANTYIYLPENQKQKWFDMLALYELGMDADPEFTTRIEFHNPNGKVYVAKTFGKESIFGKTVQKGIAARVVEWANTLLVAAYETTPGPDIDGDSVPDWYLPVIGENGAPVVKDEGAAIVLNKYTQVLWFLSHTPYWMKLEKKGIY